jgi:hypothetical protein
MALPILTKNPTEVRTGPGWTLIGPPNPTEPTWAATASKFTNTIAGYYSFGYSTSGFTLTFGAAQTATITPAEEYDPIKIVTTGRAPMTFAGDMMGVNEVVTKYAFNGGVWTTVSGTGATQIRKYQPADPGTETRCSIIFISSDQDELYWLPQVFQTGTPVRTFTKGDTTAGYTGLEWSAEKPASGSAWNYYTAGVGFVGPTITS